MIISNIYPDQLIQNKYRYISICDLVYRHTFPCGSCLTGLESKDNPVATSIPSAQILVSKYHFLLKEPEFLGKVIDFSIKERIM